MPTIRETRKRSLVLRKIDNDLEMRKVKCRVSLQCSSSVTSQISRDYQLPTKMSTLAGIHH